MAKRRIIWSKYAISERRNIYNYWNNRNKSKIFRQKLHQLFLTNLETVRNQPEIGISVSRSNARYIIVRDYLLFYNFTENEIQVLKVWDGRRDPEKLII